MFGRWFGRALAFVGFLMVVQGMIGMYGATGGGRWRARSAPLNGDGAQTPTPLPTATPTLTPTPTPTRTPAPPTLTPTPTPTPALPARWAATPVRTWATPVTLSGTIPPPRPPMALPGNRVNLLLLGIDRRPGEAIGRTDTIILVSIDPDLPSVRMLSIPRDLWVYIPGWGFNKINTAYVHGELSRYRDGGYGLLRDTLLYNFGLPTHGYALVDFFGMRQIIDTLGGVDITVRCPFYETFADPADPTITYTLSLPNPGQYHLDGNQALWYMRSRRIGGDYDRARRQQQVLESLWERLKSGGWLLRVPSLWSAVRQTVRTDLGLEEVTWLAWVGARLDRSRIRHGWLHPVVSSTVSSDGLFIYVPTEATDGYLARFLTGPLEEPSAPAIRVELLNASGNPSLGEMAVDVLRESGFAVVRVVEVEPDRRPTRALALSPVPDPATRRLLQALGIPAARLEEAPEPGAEAAYRVWLGSDFNPCAHR